jgi:hypothetical protein
MAPEGVLHIELKASRRLTLLLIAAHVTTAILLLAVPLSAVVQLALFVVITISLRASLRTHALRTAPHACVRVTVQRDGRATLELRSGEALTGQVLGDSRVNPLLTLINLRRDDNGRRTTLVLLPDSAHTDDLRALRVWLRFKIEVA